MQLNPKLSDYLARFKPKTGVKTNQPSEFWTQLDLESYANQLPYFFNIENFCIRLGQAKLTSEKICIYSDYDTDAVTATGAMYWGLIDLGFEPKNISFYAPDRLTEGYGLNPTAIAKLATEYDLIITVDCGINSTEEAEICKRSRADLIITDHHQLTGNIPDCVAVINPILGGVYTADTNKRKSVEANLSDFEQSQKTNTEVLTKIKSWLVKMENIRNSTDLNLASTSITGVGVAWFSLVWLGYFLEEVGGM